MAAEVVVVVAAVSDAALHKVFISVWPHAPPPPPLLLTNGLHVVIIVSTAVPIAFLLSSSLPSYLLCHSLAMNPLEDCKQTLLPMNNKPRRRRHSSITHLFNLSRKKELAKVSKSLRIDQQSLKLEEILLLALSEPLTFFLLQGSQTNLRIPHQKP
jgi:hypothetical protein